MQAHQPSDELLSDYASGAASAGSALLVASHLTYSASSRSKVEDMERMGGVLLSDTEPVEMSLSALGETLTVIELPEEDAEIAAPHRAGPLPQPIAEALAMDFDSIPWRFRLPGVYEFEFDGFEGEKVSLLKARPGASIPQHTHEGRELTLVLTGALQDGDAIISPGDVTEHDGDHDHKPMIIGDEDCICLIVMDGRLRFTGTFSRALNLLGE